MTLKDRVMALEKEVKSLKLADERRKLQVHALLRKVLPDGSKEQHEASIYLEKCLLRDPSPDNDQKKPYDPYCLDLWATKNSFAYEQKSRGQQLIETLTKRPPQHC